MKNWPGVIWEEKPLRLTFLRHDSADILTPNYHELARRSIPGSDNLRDRDQKYLYSMRGSDHIGDVTEMMHRI